MIHNKFLGGLAKRPLSSFCGHFKPARRHASSTEIPAAPKSITLPNTQSRRGRLLQRIHAKTPTFLHSYAEKLVNAPVSHLTSFLILHEITALVPLLGLAAFFHYSNWLPSSLKESKWATDGVGKYGHWMKKKGWLDRVDDSDGKADWGFWYGMKDRRFKVVLELAVAYAIVKALLPVRLGLCFYATPWFARRAIEPFRRMFRSMPAKEKAKGWVRERSVK